MYRAGEFLAAVGDGGSRKMLLDLLDRTGGREHARSYAQAALDGLDTRLALPDAARSQWARDATEFMRARHRFGDNISAQIGASHAATSLANRGVRLGVPFLRFKLAGTGSDVAVLVAGRQREATLIPDLVRLAEKKDVGYVGSMALSALGDIGNRDALDDLLGFVRPDFRMRIAAPLQVLANHGDATTLQALERLATDPAFGAPDQADIIIARDYLGARLSGAVKPPTMGLQPQFPVR
jgi:hypothetical protein